jgi:hypothetical protein
MMAYTDIAGDRSDLANEIVSLCGHPSAKKIFGIGVPWTKV